MASSLTPAQFFQRYRKLEVEYKPWQYGVVDDPQKHRPLEAWEARKFVVDVNGYNLNWKPKRKPTDSLQAWNRKLRTWRNSRVQQALRHGKPNLRANRPSPFAWNRVSGRLARHVYMGKASPDEISDFLCKLVANQRLPLERAALQDYSDKYVGMDCSGFVNQYFIARGDHGQRERLIVTYHDTGKRRTRRRVGDMRPRDVLIWVTSQGRIPGSKHIALLDSVLDPQSGVVRVVESTGGGSGLCDSLYYFLPARGRGNDTYFKVERRLRGARFNRSSDSYVRVVPAF